MIGEALHQFKVVLVFLTRLPVRRGRPVTGDDLAASVVMFPLVGALVGLAGGLAYTLAFWLGLTSFIAAVIAIATLAWVTGGLHEDGLADLADGLGGGRTRDEKLRIMRDSRLGTFGAITLMLAVLARTGALANIALPITVAATLVAASALSRALMALAMRLWPMARTDGLGAAAGRPGGMSVTLALVVAAAIVLGLVSWPVALAAALASSGTGLATAWLASRQLGGLSGDVLGAVQQLAEVTFLLAVVAATTRL
jgi:adenosylcobinamide-GDP ribazoletransferase